MKCPTCGAENDAANRFCDQCGTRLEISVVTAAPTAVADQPTAAASACPTCGKPVLPGEAFCDECGTPLSPAAVAPVTSDSPTVFATPAALSDAPTDDASASTICPACGHQNLPGDRFCDNCGAALGIPIETPAPVAPVEDQIVPIETEQPATVPAEPAIQPEEGPVAVPTSENGQVDQAPPIEAPVDAAPAVPVEAEPEPVTTLPSDDAPIPIEEAVERAAVPAPAPDEGAYAADRTRLEEEIGRQEQIITQFEQMQATFGAATPPAVTQGLSDARDALARAQAELDALQPPAPAVDPAEVARLEEEIGRQQQIITQFEQMQATFGAATPPAVTQGLNDARDTLARAQAELDALTGETAPALVTATPAPAPVEAAPAPVAEAPTPVEAAPAPAPTPAPAPAPAPAPSPRLVVDADGHELPLVAGKTEYIIGREDPISGIFPEVDLTPVGGETGGVSRQHARISNTNGQWTITDLHSTNYTRVDGTRIEPDTPTPIHDGAQLQLGRIIMTFRL